MRSSGDPLDQRLPVRTVLAYSALTLPMAALGLPISVYLPPFYAETIGLSLGTVGLVFTLARVWDLFTDPVMGIVVDRIGSPWGRFRHWVVISVPLLCLATVFVYFPDPDGQQGAAYLLGWMLALYVGYTVLAIAHQSWGTELAVSYDERARLFGWREVFIIAGMVGVLAMPALIEAGAGGDLDARTLEFRKVGSMGLFMLVLLPLTAAWIVRAVPERPAPTGHTVLPWRQSLALLVRNAVLRRLLLADLLAGLGTGITGALYIFLATYVFEHREYASLALLSYFAAGFLAMPLWMRLAYAIGKHRALGVAMVWSIVMLGALLLVDDLRSTTLMFAFTMIYGLAFGAAPALTRAMIADASDEDELDSGERRAGLFFALLTSTNKIGGALAVGLGYFVLEQAFGFVPGTGNDARAIDGLLLVYVWGPVLTFGGAGLLMIGYPLDRARHRAIRAALDERADAGRAFHGAATAAMVAGDDTATASPTGTSLTTEGNEQR